MQTTLHIFVMIICGNLYVFHLLSIILFFSGFADGFRVNDGYSGSINDGYIPQSYIPYSESCNMNLRTGRCENHSLDFDSVPSHSSFAVFSDNVFLKMLSSLVVVFNNISRKNLKI